MSTSIKYPALRYEMRDTRCEIRDTRCEMRDARCEIRLIMQNKPNLQNDKMNVNPLLTNYYENLRPFRNRKNKPNQTQFWLCNSTVSVINSTFFLNSPFYSMPIFFDLF